MATAYDLAELVTARAPGTGYTVLRDRVVTRPSGAYVVLYFTGGHAYTANLAAVNNRLRWTFRAVCVGSSGKQALNTADRLRSRFLGWRPFEDVGPRFVEVDDDPPLIVDEANSNDIRYSLTLTYRLHATRS